MTPVEQKDVFKLPNVSSLRGLPGKKQKKIAVDGKPKQSKKLTK